MAMSWSIARSTSTSTPCFSMIAVLTSTRPWVWLRSGELFSVQLMYIARSPEKSYVVSLMCRLSSLVDGCVGSDELARWQK